MVVFPAPESPVNHTTLFDIRTPVVGRATRVSYFTPTGARTSYIEKVRRGVVGLEGEVVPEVGAFLIGAPKSGTTWLARVLEQHPGICVSNPKEPNEVATHKGTFGRDVRLPNWERYSSCFVGEGVKLDCSVHTLSCPEAVTRISEWWPGAKFIVCLREPISRTISHWNMILDTGEDRLNGADWSNFSEAWGDPRLRVDSMYGASLSRWYNQFSSDRFLIIDSSEMRNNSESVLRRVEEHLGLESHTFNLEGGMSGNSAKERRPLTIVGSIFKLFAGLIPSVLKAPLVSSLQNRGVNVYSWPILSGRRIERDAPSKEEMSGMVEELIGDLELLETITGFGNPEWSAGLQ